MKKLLTILVIVFTLFLAGILYSSVKAQNNDYVSGQILVKFKQSVSKEEANRQLKAYQAKAVGKITALDVFVLQVPQKAEDRVLAALSKNPNIEYAEFDYLAEVFSAPNDTYFSNQWGLENTGQTVNGVLGTNDADIDAPTAWYTTKGNGTIVAILDTGVAKNHPDLSSKVVGRANFSDSSTDEDIYGHGTHVGGIVAALTDNSMGVAGGCPDCQLLSGKVLNDSGSGAYSWIANGIVWASDNGAKVINMSLGGPFKSRTLESAVNYAWGKNVIVVAAAGNSNNPSKTYPGAFTNVIAVAATNNLDKKAYFSSYGAKWVDVAAPGEYIFSAWNDGSSANNPQPTCISSTECYKYASGTSMATPMTSAVAALIWSTPYGTSASASQVRTRLESTADKIEGTGTYWSAGRVNAENAVKP